MSGTDDYPTLVGDNNDGRNNEMINYQLMHLITKPSSKKRGIVLLNTSLSAVADGHTICCISSYIFFD